MKTSFNKLSIKYTTNYESLSKKIGKSTIIYPACQETNNWDFMPLLPLFYSQMLLINYLNSRLIANFWQI